MADVAAAEADEEVLDAALAAVIFTYPLLPAITTSKSSRHWP